jgi:hypothetical protein
VVVGRRPSFGCELRNGVLVVSGYVDEHAHFAVSGAFAAVDLQAVSGFSSLGLRHFLQFLYAADATTIRLLECPVSFIETINAISGLLKGDKIAVSSLQAPYRCDACGIELDVVLDCSRVTLTKFDVQLPPQRCHRCRELLTPLFDPLEYLLFLYN